MIVRNSAVRLVLLLSLVLMVSFQVTAATLGEIDNLIETKDVAKIREAIVLLEAELTKRPQDGDVLWMTAKAHLYLGDRTEDKLPVLEKGKTYSEAAIEQLPNSPHGYYFQSALIGRIGQTKGILNSLFMVRPMKNALDRVLELDPNYADAHWVLSQLYQEAPGFPLSIGNKKLALEHAQIALDLNQAKLEYQLQYINALQYNGKKAEALALLTDFLNKPELAKEPEIKEEADNLFKKLNH